MRKFNFRRDQALWREEGLPVQLQLFHRTGRAGDRAH